ncbi:MAG TPA: cytochrome-c oxidase [Verrucomicrobiales bacterium]|nr:cytochrome-c oxidase [Verrucomicrobiales bacterium]
MPTKQLGALQPNYDTNTMVVFPQAPSGEALQGREVYRALGCNYCHTQQVRREGFGSDIERGWGKRQSVARDYIYQKPVFLGSSRTGPDLTNIGERQPSHDWHFSHLYNPQTTSKGSIMPPYAFLFDRRRIGPAGVSTNAIKLGGEFAPEAGWEVVPNPAARQLVEYLLSLKSSVSLPEAPIKKVE